MTNRIFLGNISGDAISGSGVPTVVPSNIGQVYVDIDGKKAYFAHGLTANDWKLIPDSEVVGGNGTVESVMINGITYTPDENGLIDLGTISGGNGVNLWSELGGKPTTIDGFGITDAVKTTDVQIALNTKMDKALTGVGTPSVVPSYVGQIYIDTTNEEAYVSNGLSSNDWQSISMDELGGGSGIVDWSAVLNKPNLSVVATSGNYNDLSNKPTSLPSSDVFDWAKQLTKPNYTKSEVGLGNVDNTSDVSKPVSTAQQNALNLKEDKANKGLPNGYVGLDENAKISSAYLPSYVDDVLEFANLASFPSTGEAGKIYIALDTNRTYRWSGSTYTAIISGSVDSVNGKTGVVTLVKGDIGLGNVENTADNLKNVYSSMLAKGFEIRTDRPTGADLYNGRAYILLPNIAPIAPVISLSTVGDNSITIQLTTSSTDEEDGIINLYNIYRDGVLFASDITILQSGTYQLTGFATATTCNITIKGKDSKGLLSPSSNIITATTTGANTAPTVPTNLASSNIGTSGFTLSWSASTDAQGNPVSYKVYKNGTLYQSNITTTNLAITGQTSGSNATWTVSSSDGTLESTQSTGVSVTILIPVNTSPTAPVISYISKADTSITVQLSTASTDAEDGVISTYEVYKNGVLHATTTLTQGQNYTFTGLTASTSYTLTFKGKDSSSTLSVASNSVTQTTNATAISDDFTGSYNSLPNTTLWAVSNNANGATMLDGSGNATIKSLADTDASILIRKAPILKETKTRKLQFRTTASSGNVRMGLVYSATQPTVQQNANWYGQVGLNMNFDGNSALNYRAVDGTSRYWNQTSGAWETTTSVIPIAFNTSYIYMLETTATQFRITIKNSTETTTIIQTTWVNWTDVKLDGTAMWFYAGDPLTDSNYGTIVAERYDEF